MRRKLYKLFAFIMALAMVITVFSAPASAVENRSSYTLELKSFYNSAYERENIEKLFNFSFSPKRYLVKIGDLDTDDFTDDKEEIVLHLRNVMVSRKASTTICFKDNIAHTGDTLFNEIGNWLEMILAETENSYEGDYLRYVYNSIAPGEVTVWNYAGKYYYNIPLNFEYYTTREQEEELNREVKKVIDSFGFSALSTERYKADTIYEYITKNVVYDHDNLNNDSYKLKYTAYAALINKTAVCQGYATLFYRMARECGLDVRVVTGRSFEQNHAWNIIKIDNLYYYLDSTWDAGREKYSYYLKGTDDFAEHVIDEDFLTNEFKSKYPMSRENIELSGSSENEKDFTYTVHMNRAYITGYKGNDVDVIVPSRIGGYRVYSVGTGTFDRIDNINSITFSEGIERMGESAIEACANLVKVSFPSTMKIVYEKYSDSAKSGYTEAPIYCSNLKNINVANGNPYMKMVDGILYSADGKDIILCPDNSGKTKLTIPQGVVNIAPFAFDGCESIKEVVMPDTVKMIGYWAFCSAYNLEKINISEDCRFIGQYAFANTKITNIHIPKKVDTILGAAFGMETDLKEITVDPENENFYMQNGALIYHNAEFDTRTILDYETGNSDAVFTVPNDVFEIEQYAFANAQNLEKVIIPDTVEYIRSSAFENCDLLTHFAFPNGIKEIESYILFDCENIMSIVMPESVTQIGEMLVYDNDGYTIYGKKGSVVQQYAINNSLKFKQFNEFVCTNGHTVQKHFVNEYTYYNVCTVCGDRAKTYELNLVDIDSLAQFAKVEYEYYVYTGKEIKPKIAVFKNSLGNSLVEGIDYDIIGYYNNISAGTAYIEVQGKGNYVGKGYIYYEIKPASVSNLSIGIEYLSTIYDGYEKCPIIEIDGLNEYENFQVTYINNVNPGKATAQVNIWGNYEGTVSVEFEIGLPATEKAATALYGHNDVKFAWRAVAGADGYDVYYKKSTSSSYIYKTSTTALYYNFANLTANTKYNFKVVAYYLDGGTKKASTQYKTAIATTLMDLKAPSKVTLTLYGYDDVKVSWSKVSYAKGYYVYYKTSSAKSYTYAGKTTATTFKKANLSDGVKYIFKVVPYGVSGSKIILDDSYKTASIYTLKKISTPKVTKSSSKVKVSWTNISGESGYQISQSTSKSKTKIVATYTTTTGKSKTIKATKKKTYYYKVRAFVKVGKTVIYGPWSTVKSYKLK